MKAAYFYEYTVANEILAWTTFNVRLMINTYLIKH